MVQAAEVQALKQVLNLYQYLLETLTPSPLDQEVARGLVDLLGRRVETERIQHLLVVAQQPLGIKVLAAVVQ
tara:strand:- start:230 stop:445 length:216 start_codon:yes stop_codon:yes gene_type:complete